MEYILVVMTAPNMQLARKIAHSLIAERLCACVNIVPQCISIYEWGGQIEEDNEVLMLAKTVHRQFDKLVAKVKDLHSYDVPEIIKLDISGGNENYLQWVKEIIGDELLYDN